MTFWENNCQCVCRYLFDQFWANASVWIHCCERPNYDFCISHGNVATVLKWGDQNYSRLRQVSSQCRTPKFDQHRPMFHEAIQKIKVARFYWLRCSLQCPGNALQVCWPGVMLERIAIHKSHDPEGARLRVLWCHVSAVRLQRLWDRPRKPSHVYRRAHGRSALCTGWSYFLVSPYLRRQARRWLEGTKKR